VQAETRNLGFKEYEYYVCCAKFKNSAQDDQMMNRALMGYRQVESMSTDINRHGHRDGDKERQRGLGKDAAYFLQDHQANQICEDHGLLNWQ
jgi:hypothetical protein